jgi:glycosyltransferase involved in cell wall biosynthesis
VKPCRILYHHRIRADDGQAVHVRELIAALRARGHEVLECALVPKAAAVHRSGGRRSFWQRLRLPRTAVEVMEVLYSSRGRARLLAAAREFRPDFIYERHALHCRSGLDAARALGVPLLLEVNSPMCDEMAAQGLLRLPRRARATERAVLAGADVVFAVTRVLAGMLVARGARADRMRVVCNGADPQRYGEAQRAAAAAVRQRLQLPPNAFVVGFVGYVRKWHRLDLALDAMAQPGCADLHLLCVGTGPALAELQARANELGLGGRVRFPGEVPPGLLPSYLLAADAALIPAINAYASPLKMFDSLAAGLPTVAPDQPNLREVITSGENGLLFAPGSAAALAHELGSLARDRARAVQLGAAGRQSLLQHSWTWEGNADRVVAAFHELARAESR